jgi:ribosomal protein S18 acetylase RimI-like enzyme
MENQEIVIEKPKREDYEEIADISNRADEPFLKLYSEEEAKEIGFGTEAAEGLIEGEETREYLCLKVDNKIVSFVSFRLKNPQTIWISHICTDPNFQGKGYGAKLMIGAERIAKERNAKVVVLETERQADWAVNFYLKNNYKILSDEDLKVFPFDKVLDKPQVPNRYILGKIIENGQ